jgi:hypothetical protein
MLETRIRFKHSQCQIKLVAGQQDLERHIYSALTLRLPVDLWLQSAFSGTSQANPKLNRSSHRFARMKHGLGTLIVTEGFALEICG